MPEPCYSAIHHIKRDFARRGLRHNELVPESRPFGLASQPKVRFSRSARRYTWQALQGIKPPGDNVANVLGLRPDGMGWARE